MLQIGLMEGLQVPAPQPSLRKRSHIRTIQATLAIEGNSLALEQVTAILEGRRVLGSANDIREVQNALTTYAKVKRFSPTREQDL